MVVGATGGIGRAVCQQLADQGADLLLIGLHQEPLDALTEELSRRFGVQTLAATEDLSRPGAFVPAVSLAEKYLGPIDILVSSAGDTPLGSALSVPEADWLTGWNSKFMGYLRATNAVLPSMKKEHHGRIIHVIGNSASEPMSQATVGSAINAALVNWLRTVAAELAPFDITINGINPGPVDTRRLQNIIKGQANNQGISEAMVLKNMVGRIPMGRVGHPEEIAAAVLFLASAQSGFITGTTLTIDGGMRHSPTY